MPAPEQDLTPEAKAEKKFFEDFEALLKGAQPYGPAFRRFLLFVIDNPKFCRTDGDTTEYVVDKSGSRAVAQDLTLVANGRRQIGLALRAAAQEAAPDAYMRMLQEGANAARQAAVAMMSDPNPPTEEPR